MSETLTRPRCHCGVWIDCHHRVKDHAPRKASRLRLWFVDHDLRRHIEGRIWLSFTDRWRMDVASKVHDRRSDLCWCDFVDAAVLDNKREDFACGCEVPLLRDAKKPRPGRCYCPTEATS